MRLKKVATLRGGTVGDLAAAEGRGPEQLRSLLSPLLPVLYTFVARRTHDPEDGEELLVETLLRARARARDAAVHTLPLLPWLLRMAGESMLTDVERDPVLESGLGRGWAVPRTRLHHLLLPAVAALPRESRLALGMRFGDGLPEETIADALGVSRPAAAALLEHALSSVQEAVFPGHPHVQFRSPAVEAYVAELLAGRPATPPEGLSRGAKQVLETLSALHGRAELTPAREARIWRRYEEEGEEFLPGRPLPSVPSWIPPLLLVVMLLALLVGGSLWWLGRGAEPEERLVAAPETQATAAVRPEAPVADVASSAPSAEPGSSQPGAGRDVAADGRRVARAGRGSLFYLQPGRDGATRLMEADLDEKGPAAAHPRVVLSSPQAQLAYALSPGGGRIAYSASRSGSVWIRPREGGAPRLLLALNRPATHEARVRRRWRLRGSSVTGIAWHPREELIAVASEAADPSISAPVEVRVLRLDGSRARKVATLYSSRRVSDLSWSASGRYLAANTDTGALIVDLSGRNAPARPLGQGRELIWSPPGAPDRLLWIASGPPGGDIPWAILDPRTLRYDRPEQLFSHLGWHPNGHAVVGAIYSPRPREGDFALGEYDLRTGENTRYPDMPGLGMAALDVLFLPDGKRVAYATKRGVRLADLSTGRVVRTITVEGRVRDLRWQPSTRDRLIPKPQVAEGGTVLYTAAASGGSRAERWLMGLELRTGRRVELARGSGLEYAASPFGTTVAVAAGRSLSVLRPFGGERLRVAEARRGAVIESPSWSPGASTIAYVERRPAAGNRGPMAEVWSARAADGGRRRLLARRPAYTPTSVSYAPSGRWLLLGGEQGWSLLRPKGGRRTTLPRAHRYAWMSGSDRDLLLRIGQGVSVIDADGRTYWTAPRDIVDARWISSYTVGALSRERQLRVYSRARSGYPTNVPQLLQWDRNLGKAPGRSGGPDAKRGAPWPDWGDSLSAASPTGGWLLSSNGRVLSAFDVVGGKQAEVAVEEFDLRDPSWVSVGLELQPAREAPSPSASRGDAVLLFTDSDQEPGGQRTGFRTLRSYEPATRRVRTLPPVSGYDVEGDALVYAGYDGIWRARADGRAKRPLLTYPDEAVSEAVQVVDPRWSPGGRWVSVVVHPRRSRSRPRSEVPAGLYVLDGAEGEGFPRTVAQTEEGEPPIRTARWSARGDALLASTGRGAMVLGLGGEERRAFRYWDRGEAYPSPVGGTGTILHLDHAAGEALGWLKVRHGGGEPTVLARGVHSPVWARDGGSVLYFAGSTLWQVSLDGGRRRLVSAIIPPADPRILPAWMPDGRLSFVSGRGVWAVDVEGGRAERVFRWRRPLVAIDWGTSSPRRSAAAPRGR